MYRRAKHGLGYLPQESSVFRGLSVEDNILAVLEISEPSRSRRNELVEELLGEFSLTHLRRAEAVSLSGGERRRLEIARCLATRPRYLLLDEPFAGIDPKTVGEMRELVAHLQGPGRRPSHHGPQCPRDPEHRRPGVCDRRRQADEARNRRRGGGGSRSAGPLSGPPVLRIESGVAPADGRAPLAGSGIRPLRAPPRPARRSRARARRDAAWRNRTDLGRRPPRPSAGRSRAEDSGTPGSKLDWSQSSQNAAQSSKYGLFRQRSRLFGSAPTWSA